LSLSADLKKLSKLAFANALGNRLSFSVLEHVLRRTDAPFVTAVTYHDTPLAFAEQFRSHLAWFRERYDNCDRASLDDLVHKGIWRHQRPGLIISFDDGLRSNATVAAPLLEESGFTGWFMVPARVPELDPAEQRSFARDQLIQIVGEEDGERLFMSWDDVRLLARNGHEICCHSYGHTRLGPNLSAAELEEEIALPKRLFEEKLQRPIDAFAWVGGEEHAFSKQAFDKIKACEYGLLFSTNCLPITGLQTPWCLERFHVDATYSPNQVRFATSGIYDLLYARKRRRVRSMVGMDAGEG
jgi:peptidoglycan/xylan/chitin deacetylase (PgdA/CDA1 family)